MREIKYIFISISTKKYRALIKQHNAYHIEQLVEKVNLDYNGRNPIYNGQELIDYSYNIYTARFEKNPEIAVDVELETTATSFVVTEISTGAAGAETAVAIPDGTKQFRIRVKQRNTVMEISDTSGGSFFTVGFGSTFDVDEVKTENVTLYVKLSRANRDLELLTWS